MKKNVMKMLNRLEGYKVAIKNIHWSAVNMSEHKQCDELADIVSSYEDTIAEIAQGMYGDIRRGELKPERIKEMDSRKLVLSIYSDAIKFGSTLKGKSNAGLKSENDTFVGAMKKQYYLFKKCLNEDLRRLDSMVGKILKEELNRYGSIRL